MSLQVDFNNLRNLCDAFDETVKCAIECRTENGDDSSFEELAESLDELRSLVAGVALCYDDHGNEGVLGERTLLSMNEQEEGDE